MVVATEQHRGGSGLVVHRSARAEQLLAQLVGSLQRGWPADPFTPVTIMVQSAGMARWLSHQLAQHLDPQGGAITANLELPFPGKVLGGLAAACLPDQPREDPWDPDRLVWAVLNVLESHRGAPQLARLDRYLSGPDGGGAGPVDRRRWRFARRLADVMQAYSLSRPRMVAAWSRGQQLGPDLGPLDEREHWQPWLWRALVERTGTDPAARTQQLLEVLRDPATAVPVTALRSFGISVLPPTQLELLTALADRAHVELFVPTASTVRWAAIAGALAREGTPRPAATHPLLVSCGRVVDDAAELLAAAGGAAQDGADREGDREEGDREPGRDGAGPAPTLLRWLQDGIRDDRLPDAADRPRLRVDDRSVRVLRCYGPARQAEVLRDELLRLLADDPSLEPRDLLVMTPDIAVYGPLVEAAFVAAAGVPGLPVRVADRGLGAGNPVAEVLTALLDLAGSRVTSTQVLDLLARPPVAARFQVGAELRERAAAWLAETGVRWGIDADHRQRHGQPADRAHTWRFGLDRLLLGATMADEDHRVIGGTTPYDHVEGDDVVGVGRLADACQTLFAAVADLQAPRSVTAWVDVLEQVLERCVATEPADRWQVDEVRARLDLLRGTVAAPGPVLDLGAVAVAVAGVLDDRSGTAGYETGAVTLCELVPMRSIPHRVVALLGIDEGSFPRSDRRPGFDLLERHDAVGDRDRRREDRALFLEAILAARQHLLVTTTGWDVQTGEQRPPAVPLAELLEAVDATVAADGPASAAVTVDLPLHPFSPAAFDPRAPDGPHGVDPTLVAVAELTRRSGRSSAPLVADPLPDSEVGTHASVVTLRELMTAATAPTRTLLRDRLGVDLREQVVELDELEPLDLGHLQRAQLGRAALLEGTTPAWVQAQLAAGAVPAGTPGRSALSQLTAEVAELRAALRATAHQLALPVQRDPVADGERHQVELSFGERTLVGEVAGVHPPTDPGGRSLRLLARFARRNPTHLMEAWIEHLALTAQGRTSLVSVVVTRSSAKDRPPHRWLLGPLHDDPEAAVALARGYLSQLLELRDDAYRERLPLFARAAYALLAPGRSTPMAAARNAFASDFGPDDRDAEVLEVYGPQVTLDDVLATPDERRRFTALARAIWGPAVAADGQVELDGKGAA